MRYVARRLRLIPRRSSPAGHVKRSHVPATAGLLLAPALSLREFLPLELMLISDLGNRKRSHIGDAESHCG